MSAEGEICVVDDDAAIRDAVRALLRAHGFTVRCFESGRAFLDACAAAPADCVLLDLWLPEFDGLQILSALAERGIDMPVVMMTAHGNVAVAVEAMRQGARDFIEKPFTPEDLVACLNRAVRDGHAARSRRAQADAVRQRLKRLTSREREVLEQVAAGRSNKHTARALGISPRTVEIHRAHLMDKMEAHNLSDLVRMALSVGLGES